MRLKLIDVTELRQETCVSIFAFTTPKSNSLFQFCKHFFVEMSASINNPTLHIHALIFLTINNRRPGQLF